jgi:HicB family
MSTSSPQTTRSERRSRGSSDPSGRLLLRMPRSLHGALAQVAERDGTSLNQLITGTLASAIGWTGEGAGEGVVPDRAPDPAAEARSKRTLTLVLIANAVAVGLAALAAIGLLLYALLG